MIWVYFALLTGPMSASTLFIDPATTSVTPAIPPHVFTLSLSTDHVVIDVTRNVSLDCEFNASLPSTASSVVEISRIRILQADSADNWHLLADIRDNEVGIHVYDHILASGRIDSDISKSYLKITWETAQDSTSGRYRCDVSGFDRNLNAAFETSNLIKLEEGSITAKEVFDMLVDERARLDLQKEALKSLETKCNHTHYWSGLNQSDNKWPEGKYSLLSPFDGCPRFRSWRRGFIKIHTESSGSASSKNEVSAPSNLTPYTLLSADNDSFVVLTFCSVVKDNTGSAWPNGSYCINQYGSSCPSGFSLGYIRFDDEDDSDNKRSFGGMNPNIVYEGSFAKLYFCCRSDGLSQQPIILPTRDPFYLYRHGGTCQKVLDMNVTAEFLNIDTEDDSNGDQQSGSYPDGSLDDLKLELCYYQPIS